MARIEGRQKRTKRGTHADNPNGRCGGVRGSRAAEGSWGPSRTRRRRKRISKSSGFRLAGKEGDGREQESYYMLYVSPLFLLWSTHPLIGIRRPRTKYVVRWSQARSGTGADFAISLNDLDYRLFYTSSIVS